MPKFTPDNLIAGEYPLITHTLTIAKGQVLERGAVIGRQMNGSCVLSQINATDGSEKPFAILAQTVDASKSEQDAVCYLTGQFNSTSLIYGEGFNSQNIFPLLRAVNIYIAKSI